MGETRIISFGGSDGDKNPDSSASEGPLDTFDEEAAPWVESEAGGDFGARETDRFGLVAAALGILVAAGWTGYFIWAHHRELGASPAPDRISSLVAEWAIPVLLIAVLWLLAMRTSWRETRRFGHAASLLARESADLERRLVTVNRELSLAREFLASQSRDLETLGRLASERLSENAGRLESLIRDNGARVDTISNVSRTALENMDKLRGQLPVIASSAKDVTNNIGNAGRSAQSQLEELIGGFRQLKDLGSESEAQVSTLRERIESALSELSRQCDAIESAAGQRFDALAERGEAMRLELDKHEIDALAAIRSRADALRREVEDTRAHLDGHEAESLASLRTRLAALRDEGDGVARALVERQDRLLESWRRGLQTVETESERIAHGLRETESGAERQFAERVAGLERDIAKLDGLMSERREAFDTAQRGLADEIRALHTRLGSEIDEQARRSADDLAARRDRLTLAHAESVERLDGMLAELDRKLTLHREAQARDTEALRESSGRITEELEHHAARLGEVAQSGSALEQSLERSLEAIGQRLTASRASLAATDGEVERLTDAAVRLLELIQASANSASKDLPEAIAVSEDRLARASESVSDLQAAVGRVVDSQERLSGTVEETEARIRSIGDELDSNHAKLTGQSDEQRRLLEALTKSVGDLDARTREAADAARNVLAAAIEKLANSAKDTVQALETDAARKVVEIAERLGEDTSSALERAVRQSAAEATGRLEQAAAHASGVGREAAIQLRDQLAKVNELVANLENRVSHARQRAEEQVDNDFARRVALLTESLNSNAIDIAKALSTDVSDTAWAAYLRGDRGIFTRRAVSLLDSGEVRRVQQAFENDDEFRAHVSRYIHDFEAILRQILSTRDGNALGVTLLSSDMGKLYVALAQGIERLRG
ncbi:hypothetical protein B2G71_08175 [Novosphingobium sp. PC22D]|uniref:ATPase n=1 Tax=Novosphingobium sp. PC22D TaxID=1962403 RepID=UPI000BF005F7|nr:ATPase [Novosphingobium sp. PC22D]PEQ13395.1 hypothetical protein B2G71_08175 [Novosphingobium sp. PC22D]